MSFIDFFCQIFTSSCMRLLCPRYFSSVCASNRTKPSNSGETKDTCVTTAFSTINSSTKCILFIQRSSYCLIATSLQSTPILCIHYRTEPQSYAQTPPMLYNEPPFLNRLSSVSASSSDSYTTSLPFPL